MSTSARGVTLWLAVMASLVAFAFLGRGWPNGAGAVGTAALLLVALGAALASTALGGRK